MLNTSTQGTTCLLVQNGIGLSSLSLIGNRRNPWCSEIINIWFLGTQSLTSKIMFSIFCAWMVQSRRFGLQGAAFRALPSYTVRQISKTGREGCYGDCLPYNHKRLLGCWNYMVARRNESFAFNTVPMLSKLLVEALNICGA